MKRVFVIHRWEGGSHDDWRPWLKGELEKRGYEVVVPDMPDTETPVIEAWINHLASIVGLPDKDTYFVGHSIGCQAILRYIETISTPIGGAVFVAGWFTLEHLENESVQEIANPWITTPIDFAKIKTMLPISTLIISDNDPFGAFEENKKAFAKIGSTIVVLHHAGHMTTEDGYTRLPQIISVLETF